MGVSKAVKGHLTAVKANRQLIASLSNLFGGDAGRLSRLQHHKQVRAADGDDIAALVLTEEIMMLGQIPMARIEARPDIARECHLRYGDQKASVGYIMDSRDLTRRDQASDEGTVPFFDGQIDRRRRAFFTSMKLPQIERLP